MAFISSFDEAGCWIPSACAKRLSWSSNSQTIAFAVASASTATARYRTKVKYASTLVRSLYEVEDLLGLGCTAWQQELAGVDSGWDKVLVRSSYTSALDSSRIEWSQICSATGWGSFDGSG